MFPPVGLPAREAAANERQPPTLDTWPRMLRAAAIVANQFGTRCDRLLLVHDNLGGAGLGWSSNYWAIALAAAVQAGRVLHAVPSPSSANSSLATRWCDRPPFTLECYYLRWNDCEGTPLSDEVHHPAVVIGALILCREHPHVLAPTATTAAATAATAAGAAASTTAAALPVACTRPSEDCACSLCILIKRQEAVRLARSQLFFATITC